MKHMTTNNLNTSGLLLARKERNDYQVQCLSRVLSRVWDEPSTSTLKVTRIKEVRRVIKSWYKVSQGAYLCFMKKERNPVKFHNHQKILNDLRGEKRIKNLTKTRNSQL